MIKQIFMTVACLVMLSTCCFSQHTFIRYYSKESVVSFLIRQHTDGSYRLFSRYNATGHDLNSTVTTINEYGDSTELLKFGLEGNEYIEDVVLDGDRYLMAGCHNQPNGYTEPIFLKMNSPDTTGTLYRSYSLTSRDATFIKVLPLGGYYYLVGGKYVDSQKWYDVNVVKADTNGNVIWDKNYGYERSDWVKDAIVTQDGGILLVGGRFRIEFGWKKIYAIKIDSAGNEQWSQTIGNPGDTLDGCSLDAYGVVQATNGNYYIAGYNDNWCSEYANRGTDASVLLCLDSGGNQLWMHQDQFEIKYFPGLNDTVFQHQGFFNIALAADGNIVCAGEIRQNIDNDSSRQDVQVLLAKFDLNGNLIWKKYYGDEGYNDIAYDLIRTQDNGYAICGRYEDVDHPFVNVKSFVIKTNECGCITGCDATCETVVGIDKQLSYNRTVKLYPNPATDHLTIESLQHFDLIEVKDILGRVLLTLDHPSENQIKISKLNKGLYFLSAYTKEREVYNASFIKN